MKVIVTGGAGSIGSAVVRLICDLLDEFVPGDRPRRGLIPYVADRSGHDARSAIDIGKITSELALAAGELA